MSKLPVRSSHQRCSVKKGVLRNFAKFTGAACNFIKKEILAQVFSCEFCEISKNTFFTEHVWATASVPAHFFVYRGTYAWSIFIEILLEVAVWSEGKLLIAKATYFSRKALKMKSAFSALSSLLPIA